MAQVKRGDSNDKLSRREWLREIVAGGGYLSFAQQGLARLLAAVPAAQGGKLIQQTPFSPDDEAFLEELEQANFLFFWEQTNPETGMVRDRCNVRAPDSSVLSSIAATGFGLTALCIGDKRGFISDSEART